jgi:hypothetical protein
MSSQNAVRIFTTPYYQSLFDLDKLDVTLIARPLQEVVKEYLSAGFSSDICIMPFVAKYKSLLETFRAKNLHGPVIFITDKLIDYSTTVDIYKNGAILIDVRFERTDFVKLLLLYLIQNLRSHENADKDESLSEDFGILGAIQSSYRGAASRKGRLTTTADGATITSALKEAVDVENEVSFDLISQRDGISKAPFTFTYTLTDNDKSILLSCVATLSRVLTRSEPIRHHILFFDGYHPQLAHNFLEKQANDVKERDILGALGVQGRGANVPNAVEAVFELDEVSRNCIMLPVLEDDKLAFIPISNASIQKRRYFRMVPSSEHPLIAFVSSERFPTQSLSVIDVSERGLAFWSPALLQVTSEVSVCLQWGDSAVVCAGITRFSAQNERQGQSKIGIELYPHKNDCTRLREYVFTCQLGMLKKLRSIL